MRLEVVLAASGDVPTQESWPLPTCCTPWASSSRSSTWLICSSCSPPTRTTKPSPMRSSLSCSPQRQAGPVRVPLLCPHVRGLIYDRPNHDNFNVHGYEEKGSTTTPYDMVRVNNMDRYELAADALRMIDADKYADQIDELGGLPSGSLPVRVDKGYDHPDLHRLGLARRRSRNRCRRRTLRNAANCRRQRVASGTASRWGLLRAGCLAPGSGLRELPRTKSPSRAGPLDRFDMRGLIFFNVMGTWLLRPWGCASSFGQPRLHCRGRGGMLCFEKFAEPTSQNKACLPGPRP